MCVSVYQGIVNWDQESSYENHLLNRDCGHQRQVSIVKFSSWKKISQM